MQAKLLRPAPAIVQQHFGKRLEAVTRTAINDELRIVKQFTAALLQFIHQGIFFVRIQSERPSGLHPIAPTDAGEFTAVQEEEFAREAWATGESVLTRFVEVAHPLWAAQWRKSQAPAVTEPVELIKAGRPYRISELFAAGDVIDHPTFGLGDVEAVLVDSKIQVRFGHESRVLIHGRVKR